MVHCRSAIKIETMTLPVQKQGPQPKPRALLIGHDWWWVCQASSTGLLLSATFHCASVTRPFFFHLAKASSRDSPDPRLGMKVKLSISS